MIEKIKGLITQLNLYRDMYYNHQTSLVSDKEYDDMFDELQRLENETGIVFSNSPTQSVGYEVKSELRKVVHNHPMLSLDKTKDLADIEKFFGEHIGFLMLKMDGLTVSLRYINGELISAETRGNGEIGEDILHNAKVFTNIPLHINCKDEVIVDGEAIIDYDTFKEINSTLPEENRYKNPRNLVSGSVRQLDSGIAASRKIKFIAWKLVKGNDRNSFISRLEWLENLGFETVDYRVGYPLTIGLLKNFVDELKESAVNHSYPIDGLVASYDDIVYGESLGLTSHHIRSQIAYKFYDEIVETPMFDVEWTMGKTGVLTPTAIFLPVEIDGTTVERASLHNVSIFENLNLYRGDTVTVFKANQIIPQISENIDKGSIREVDRIKFEIPSHCPICGGETVIKQDGVARVLHCVNDNCSGKLLGKLTHFVSKNAMNIDGLSESTLEKFINLGFLNTFIDIYKLNDHYNEIVTLDGFGKRSADKLITAIENSKHTTLDRFLYALCIPLIGRTASKTISKYFHGDYIEFRNQCMMHVDTFDFTIFDDFGIQMASSIADYIASDVRDEINELAKLMDFGKEQIQTNSCSLIVGKTFVITGSVNHYKNRNELSAYIENLGGKVAGSVSKNTDYLINNDVASTSGKNKKAKELGVPIISEEEFIKMTGD